MPILPSTPPPSRASKRAETSGDRKRQEANEANQSSNDRHHDDKKACRPRSHASSAVRPVLQSVSHQHSRNTEYLAATTRCLFVLRRQSNVPSAVHSYLKSSITMLCYTVAHYNCAMNQHSPLLPSSDITLICPSNSPRNLSLIARVSSKSTSLSIRGSQPSVAALRLNSIKFSSRKRLTDRGSKAMQNRTTSIPS